MKIKFMKDFAGCNFGAIHGDIYKKDSDIEVVESPNGFDPKLMISEEMAKIAIDNHFACEIIEPIKPKEIVKEVENIEYETKVIEPEKKVIKPKAKPRSKKKKKK